MCISGYYMEKAGSDLKGDQKRRATLGLVAVLAAIAIF